MGETAFFYHVPSATDPNIQILKLCIVSDFRHINNVYNLYFRDQMVVQKKIMAQFFFLRCNGYTMKFMKLCITKTMA